MSPSEMKYVAVLFRSVCRFKQVRSCHSNYIDSKNVENPVLDSPKTSLPDGVSSILESCPELRRIPKSELSERLDVWARCRFGDKACVKLLMGNPQLLLLPSSRVKERFLKLSDRFSTNKNVFKIISNSPNSMIETWKTVEDKLDYLLIEMKVSSAEIAGSGALLHSLDHIKTRFRFLSRAGLYKIPKAKETPETQFKNPKLDDILNTSEKYFSTRIAGLTSLEFEVFQQMMESEEDSDSD